MKKVTIILATLLCLSLIGCSSDVKNTTSTSEANGSFAATKEEFSKKIEEMVNVSEYNISEGEGSKVYNIKKENRIDYNFDYTIKISENQEITFPIEYKTVTENGWEYNGNEDFIFYKENIIQLTNSENQQITIKTSNPETEDTLKKSICYGISIKLDGTVNAPRFSICNGITQDSTVSEIIDNLGKPSSIQYYESDGFVIIYGEGEWHSITFTFTTDGKMRDMTYEYNSSNLI